MIIWPLKDDIREHTTNFLGLRTLGGGPQRFNDERAFFKNDGLIKSSIKMNQILKTDSWTITFWFENFSGMQSYIDYPLFCIVPTFTEGFTGQDATHAGLKIVYNYPEGIQIYLSGDSPYSFPLISYPLDCGIGAGPSYAESSYVDSGEVELDPIEGAFEEGQLYYYIPFRKHKLELSCVKNGGTTYLSLYIDNILVEEAQIGDNELTSTSELNIGAVRGYTFNGDVNNFTSYSYYIGCVWMAGVDEHSRKAIQDESFFHKYMHNRLGVQPKKAFGGSYNEGRTLFMDGTSPNNEFADYRTLFIYGTTLSAYLDQRTLYMFGGVGGVGFDADFLDLRDLYISGSQTTTNSRDLYIKGLSYEVGYPLYLEASVFSSNQSRDLSIFGSSGTSYMAGRDLFMQGGMQSWGFPLFIASNILTYSDALTLDDYSLLVLDNGEYLFVETGIGVYAYFTTNPLYMKGGNDLYVAERPLFLQNDAGFSEFYKTAFIKGDGAFGGAYPFSQGHPLFMARQSESWGVPLFIGQSTTTASPLLKTLILTGANILSDTRTLAMPNVQMSPDQRILYVNGW